jgi:hypothetical protein
VKESQIELKVLFAEDLTKICPKTINEPKIDGTDL